MVRVLAWLFRSVFPFDSDVLSAVELRRAKKILIMFAQTELLSELRRAAESGKGRFRKLAPILDRGIWRVGSRMQLVPFTIDAQLPALIPYKHRITSLIMRKAHEFAHTGQDGTVSRFRALGFWTVRCGHLAKSIKEQCVPCRKTSGDVIQQPMGGIPTDRLVTPYAWGYCQLDLFGPFKCRGDVNPRTSKKTWGLIIEDVNSGAVYLDIVQDYSCTAVLQTLRRFGSLRGWPGVICSDPGSQLESAGGKLERWWAAMEKGLLTFSSTKNFKWELSPADSPWRQGKAERRISIIKRLIGLSVGDSRVTPLELQTILMEIANICNERPIGLSKPRADGSYTIVTPNQLLLGRSLNILPDDTEITESLPVASRYRILNHVTTNFWQRWSREVSPGLVVRQKWHRSSRNVKEGDVVMICDSSKLKSKYKLGVVDTAKTSTDGYVRSAIVRYSLVQKAPSGADRVSTQHVTRSVQRLVMILPVEEQEHPVLVKDNEVSVECVKASAQGEQ